MFLKSLTLRGFKTFADATVLEFDENARITAIVGPNGCGKSNLLDAVRWVLGEDNPRELRVGSLSDIIFAGTLNRKALSMAEVALTFDNSTNKFNLPYTEVGIKRRTFKEGESEFFINKNTCRLKDIRDLLNDTGLGEGTYSIITQGKVDAILSSKGEDRRMVFEEAAGINKYKSRKISAQRKLISAEQNILRINDLKIEISEQIITLEEQARKAKTYLEIQARVRELDIAMSRRQMLNLFDRKEKLQAELQKIKEASQQKQTVEEQDELVLQGLKDKQRLLEDEIDLIIGKLDEEKDRLRDVELERRFLEGEIQREKSRLDTLGQEQENLKNKIEGILHQLEEERKGLDFSSAPLGSEFEAAFTNLKQLIEELSQVFLFLGGKGFSLLLGGSHDREETLKIKHELLAEESQKNIALQAKARTAIQINQEQLEKLIDQKQDLSVREELMRQLATKKQEKEKLFNQVCELEEKIRREEKNERQALGEEAILEVALAKIDTEAAGIVERLSLEYNLTQEETLQYNSDNLNLAGARKELEEGKARLRALEPVNLLAVDEFEKGKERLTFIETQLNDLNASRENLQNLIQELDTRAQETFLTTMQQLSEVFSQTFATLFAGGEAKITLTPDVPVLEAEVEISVRPAGRKWLPLTLLSGGERSLSAIAILFSLLKIRPSPFCFLDEVDAALDEANIGRFAAMLQEFSAHSQIVVITHNKRTMAVADNIYGVTMEEAGISKILSMKLQAVN